MHQPVMLQPTMMFGQLPQAPRITVPPPNDAVNTTTHHLSCPDFIKDGGLVVVLKKHQPWSYEERNSAQQILPYLFLGPSTMTRNEAFFRENNITLGLGIKSKTSSLMEPAIARIGAMDIEAKAVEFEDTTQLIKTFSTTNKVIADHIVAQHAAGKPANVFFFCETGNEKSAAYLAAFIMYAHRSVDHVLAMQICQIRFCSNFNNSFRQQLACYYDLLNAQRDVASTDLSSVDPANLAAPIVKTSLKRGSEDMDVDMDETTGELLEGDDGRAHGQAPYDDSMFFNLEDTTE